MTFKTAKRLYDFYIENGMKDRAEDLAKKRPELLPKPKPSKTSEKVKK